nr:MAG TPA: hypothetical protein [Bacteriophage sp.]
MDVSGDIYIGTKRRRNEWLRVQLQARNIIQTIVLSCTFQISSRFINIYVLEQKMIW